MLSKEVNIEMKKNLQRHHIVIKFCYGAIIMVFCFSTTSNSEVVNKSSIIEVTLHNKSPKRSQFVQNVIDSSQKQGTTNMKTEYLLEH